MVTMHQEDDLIPAEELDLGLDVSHSEISGDADIDFISQQCVADYSDLPLRTPYVTFGWRASSSHESRCSEWGSIACLFPSWQPTRAATGNCH